MGDTHFLQRLIFWRGGLDEFLSIETTVTLCFYDPKQSLVLWFLFSSLDFSPCCCHQPLTLSSHISSDTETVPWSLPAPCTGPAGALCPVSVCGWLFAFSPGKMDRIMVFTLLLLPSLENSMTLRSTFSHLFLDPFLLMPNVSSFSPSVESCVSSPSDLISKPMFLLITIPPGTLSPHPRTSRLLTCVDL